MALFALFVAVFISLSSRLASAQSQQAARAAALGHLQDCLERVKQQGPANWSLPLRETIVEQGATYEVEIEQAGALAPDRSFGRIVGRVRWGSVTGDRMIEREVWVHEHLY